MFAFASISRQRLVAGTGETIPDGSSRRPEVVKLSMLWTYVNALQELTVAVLPEAIRFQGRTPIDRLTSVEVDGLTDRVVYDGSTAIHGHLKPPLAAPGRRVFVQLRTSCPAAPCDVPVLMAVRRRDDSMLTCGASP